MGAGHKYHSRGEPKHDIADNVPADNSGQRILGLLYETPRGVSIRGTAHILQLDPKDVTFHLTQFCSQGIAREQRGLYFAN